MAEGFIDPYNRNPKSGNLSHPEWLQYCCTTKFTYACATWERVTTLFPNDALVHVSMCLSLCHPCVYNTVARRTDPVHISPISELSLYKTFLLQTLFLKWVAMQYI